MAIDPQVKKILENSAKLGLPPAYTLSVKKARERLHNAFTSNGVVEDIARVENIEIPTPGFNLGLRAYYPLKSKKVLPCLLFFHGGGWTLNDLDTHDKLCRSLANNIGIVVLSVDYRLAPEHKYPAAIEDAYTAFNWVYNNAKRLRINNEKIGVGGDSSGGYQAAVLCQLARDRNAPKILFQWLAYPVTDYYLPGSKSYREMAQGYSLNRNFMIWFWNNYLPNDIDVNDPYISPLRASNFDSLPPAFIQTANFDPLRDEGESYGEKLKKANIKVTIKRYAGLMHGFLLQRHAVKKADEAFFDVVKTLKSFYQ